MVSEQLSLPPTSTCRKLAENSTSVASWAAFPVLWGFLPYTIWHCSLKYRGRLASPEWELTQQSSGGSASVPVIHLRNTFTMSQALSLRAPGLQ